MGEIGTTTKALIIISVVAIIASVATIVFLSELEFEKNKFIGTWSDEEGRVYTFAHDGTFTGTPYGILIEATYDVEDGRLIFTYGDMVLDEFEYRFLHNDRTLVLTTEAAVNATILTKQ